MSLPIGDPIDPVGDPPHRAGSFRFLLADQRWEWSPEVERIHGYGPGEVEPTTELMLSHKHPDDGNQVEATLDEVVRTGRSFNTRHRIVDTQGGVRDVVVVGDRLLDDTGGVIGTHGYYVDVTPSAERAHQRSVANGAAENPGNRTIIEQAKGMLMVVYRIDAEAAFDLLSWRSQACSVTLAAIAEQIISDFLGVTYQDVLPSRATYDELLLTAHERIADEA